ncbi:hypothetical protein BH23CHL2_BH23CHL2_04820 [soil metagenome]
MASILDLEFVSLVNWWFAAPFSFAFAILSRIAFGNAAFATSNALDSLAFQPIFLKVFEIFEALMRLLGAHGSFCSC